MKYVNANDVLPEELLLIIQKYYQGGYLYIPKGNYCEVRKQTDYKIELEKRNYYIYLKHLEGRLQSGTIQFVTVGQLFPYVLYIMPVLNPYLQKLALQISDAVSGIPETTISKYYGPQSWLPHVTLAKTLSKEEMQRAFSVVQEKFSVFQAQVTEIGLAKVNPHNDVLRFALN